MLFEAVIKELFFSFFQSLLESTHNGSYVKYDVMTPLNQQHKYFSQLRFPVYSQTEAWKEKASFLFQNLSICLHYVSEIMVHLISFAWGPSKLSISFPFASYRSRGFIFYLLSKSRLWMCHPTWKLGGGLLSFQIHCSWKCLMLPKSATCFPFRKFHTPST